jgi:hypothetical protein
MSHWSNSSKMAKKKASKSKSTSRKIHRPKASKPSSLEKAMRSLPSAASEFAKIIKDPGYPFR